jgi:hypothetical protein
MAIKRYDKMTPAQLQTLGDAANALSLVTPPIEFIGWCHTFYNSGADDSTFLEALYGAMKGDHAVNVSKVYPDHRVWRLDTDDASHSANWTNVSTSWKVVSSGSLGIAAAGIWGWDVSTGLRYRRISGAWVQSNGMREEWERMSGAALLTAASAKTHDITSNNARLLRDHNISFNPTHTSSDWSPLLATDVQCTSKDSSSLKRRIIPYINAADNDLWKPSAYRVGWTFHADGASYMVAGRIDVGLWEVSVLPTVEWSSNDASIVTTVSMAPVYFGPDNRWTVRIVFADSAVPDGDWYLDYTVSGDPVEINGAVQAKLDWVFYRDKTWAAGTGGPVVAFTADTYETMEWDDDAWIESANYAGINFSTVTIVTTPAVLCFWSARSCLLQLNDWPEGGTSDDCGSERTWYSPQSASIGGPNPISGETDLTWLFQRATSTDRTQPGYYRMPNRAYWPIFDSEIARREYEASFDYGSGERFAIYGFDVLRPVTADGKFRSNASDLVVDIGWLDTAETFHNVVAVTIPAGLDRAVYPDRDNAGKIEPLIVFGEAFVGESIYGASLAFTCSGNEKPLVIPHWAKISYYSLWPHTWGLQPHANATAVAYHIHAWHYNLVERLLGLL